MPAHSAPTLRAASHSCCLAIGCSICSKIIIGSQLCEFSFADRNKLQACFKVVDWLRVRKSVCAHNAALALPSLDRAKMPWKYVLAFGGLNLGILGLYRPIDRVISELFSEAWMRRVCMRARSALSPACQR